MITPQTSDEKLMRFLANSTNSSNGVPIGEVSLKLHLYSLVVFNYNFKV
jgi:hypothetical protein